METFLKVPRRVYLQSGCGRNYEPVWLLVLETIFCFQNSKTGFITVVKRLVTCFENKNNENKNTEKHEN
jgi:hypothetical protein